MVSGHFSRHIAGDISLATSPQHAQLSGTGGFLRVAGKVSLLLKVEEGGV